MFVVRCFLGFAFGVFTFRGFELRVSRSGFLGFRGSGLSRFGVSGSGFLGSGFWVSCSGFHFGISRSGFEVFGVSRLGFRVSPSGFGVSRLGLAILRAS